MEEGGDPQWTHVALVYRDRAPSLYVRGVLVRAAALRRESCIREAHVGGDYAPDDVFTGKYRGRLDDIRIYGRSLEASEVSLLAEGYTSVPRPNAPSAPTQTDPARGVLVPAGEPSLATGFLASALTSSPARLEVALQVEVRPLGTGFDGTPSATGTMVPSGTAATVQVEGLSLGSYRWRVRTVDSLGNTSVDWTDFAPDDQDPKASTSSSGVRITSPTCLASNPSPHLRGFRFHRRRGVPCGCRRGPGPAGSRSQGRPPPVRWFTHGFRIGSGIPAPPAF